MSAKVQLPNDRFSCESCGRCCTGWTVTVDAQTVKQLKKHDWNTSVDPFIPLAGSEALFRIKLINNRCFFLDAKNRCRIHNEISYEAKPAGCKAFPLMFTDVHNTSYGRLSFYCPTVRANRGKPLQEQGKWANNVLRSLSSEHEKTDLTSDGEHRLTAGHAVAIDQLLLDLFQRADAPIADRIAAGAGLVIECVEQQPCNIERLRKIPFETLSAKGRQQAAASRGKSILGLYLAADCPANRWSRLRQFMAVRFFNLGISRFHSHFLQQKASWKEINATTFTLSDESAALLTRYFLHKLSGRRHWADQHNLLVGYNRLALAYATIVVLAKLCATGRKQTTTDDESIQRAVEAADLLVVEHTSLHHSQATALIADRLLNQTTLCSSLLACVSAES